MIKDSKCKVFNNANSTKYILWGTGLTECTPVRSEFVYDEESGEFKDYHYVTIPTGEELCVALNDVFSSPEDYENGKPSITDSFAYHFALQQLANGHECKVVRDGDCHIEFYTFSCGEPKKTCVAPDSFAYKYGNVDKYEDRFSTAWEIFPLYERTFATREDAFSFNEYSIKGYNAKTEYRKGANALLLLDEDQQSVVDQLRVIIKTLPEIGVLLRYDPENEKLYAYNTRHAKRVYVEYDRDVDVDTCERGKTRSKHFQVCNLGYMGCDTEVYVER